MFENLLIERDAAVAVVTINRPQVLNALDSATLDELRHAVIDAGDDAGVRAVILTGAGTKAFLAGADVRERAPDLAAKPPVAVRAVIGCVNRGSDTPLDRAQFLEASLFGLVAATEDRREGTAALLEKRQPAFKGR